MPAQAPLAVEPQHVGLGQIEQQAPGVLAKRHAGAGQLLEQARADVQAGRGLGHGRSVAEGGETRRSEARPWDTRGTAGLAPDSGSG